MEPVVEPSGIREQGIRFSPSSEWRTAAAVLCNVHPMELLESLSHHPVLQGSVVPGPAVFPQSTESTSPSQSSQL